MRRLKVHAAYAALTHVGGSGHNTKKVNQDACFSCKCGPATIVWGVLDGHGTDNGWHSHFVISTA